MFNKKSTESVLKEIYEAYPDAFADGRRLSGLFADFSGGQLRAQKNQLDIFLKCGGNTRILALRDEPPRIQQREYRRLVGEMTDTYGMQQELALEISSTFWKTALGTQAPAMGGQEKKEKPAKKPSEKQPRVQRIKGLLSLFGKMSGFARLMFVVGAYGVIACTIRLVGHDHRGFCKLYMDPLSMGRDLSVGCWSKGLLYASWGVFPNRVGLA